MKIIKASKRSEIPENFTGIVEVTGSGTKGVYPDGTIIYFLNGKFHREDGPAIDYKCGQREYWLYGKRHREDGPAVEIDYYVGDEIKHAKYFYINGEELKHLHVY